MELEERVTRIEGILEQMDKRFSDLDKRFELMDRRIAEFRDDFNQRLNHIESELKELRGKVRSMFRWSIGLTVGVWATIITLMLPILLRLLGMI